MPDLSLTVIVLLAWVLLAGAIAVVFFVIPSRRRSGLEQDLDGDPRSGPADRRSAARERRIGLPDTRPVRIERRRGAPDRRRGQGDRRRSPAAMA